MGVEEEVMNVSQLNAYSIVVCSIWSLELIIYMVAFSSVSVQ